MRVQRNVAPAFYLQNVIIDVAINGVIKDWIIKINQL